MPVSLLTKHLSLKFNQTLSTATGEMAVQIVNDTITHADYILVVEGAVGLVTYAFKNGRPGDIFVQKAPAATVGDLAQALLEIFGARNKVRVIGTRHGEKLYETLLNREEMARAEDLGDYYRIPADCRGLDYACYFTEGEPQVSSQEDYNSHNTRRLEVGEIKDMLLKMTFVQEALSDGKAGA